MPVYVDRSADVLAAAEAIVNSKAFDCSTICATEQSVVADEPIAAALRAEMERLGRLLGRPRRRRPRSSGRVFTPAGR